MKITVLHNHGPGDDQQKLASMCADLTRAIEDQHELATPNAPDAAVTIVLGGRHECTKWGVDPDALGFLAVISDCKPDEEGPVGEDDEDPPGYFEIADGFEVHVNIEAGCHLLQAADEPNRASDLFAFLVTVPHELLHMRDWISETGGKTPLEVFDGGRGEIALKETLAAIEARYTQRGDSCEDAVERDALAITSRVLDGRIDEMLTDYPWAPASISKLC